MNDALSYGLRQKKCLGDGCPLLVETSPALLCSLKRLGFTLKKLDIDAHFRTECGKAFLVNYHMYSIPKTY